MGRKNWKEFVSEKGPGRKARKQGNPELPLQVQEQDKSVKKVKTGAVGGRIKQRARKRASVTAKVAKQLQGAKGYAAVPPPPPPMEEEEAIKVPVLEGAPVPPSAQDCLKRELFKGGSSGKWLQCM